MLLDKLGQELIYLDGGMGTLLQERGLQPGELPEVWNLTRAEDIIGIHRQYLEAGSQIILTNTFGANACKFRDSRFTLAEVVCAAVANAKEARRRAGKTPAEALIALDVGPTGKLLEPLGDLGFEAAYAAFKEVMEIAAASGVDLIQIETMSDTYEVKAAVLAAKENTALPVFATMIFEENGKLLTGGDIPAAVALLEGLRVDALGLNCGLGPRQMVGLVQEIARYSSLPLIVKPNAGLPEQVGDAVVYNVGPTEFGTCLAALTDAGASVIGGCCGTTPAHIKALTLACAGKKPTPVTPKDRTIVSAYGPAAVFGERSLLIGERINPTGKKKFKQALQDHNLDYILREAVTQQEAGADILDVNVGLPDIDETAMMADTIRALQGVTNLPLQIDTVKPAAMAAALRCYNGKPLLNSVNGKQSSMAAVFPLVAKYGGVVVGLTIDEDGIPETAAGRLQVAEKIVTEAAKYGIPRKDILIDVLSLTISSEPRGALTTLAALKLVKERLGVRTVLGVSNISFGLPRRPLINASFYTMALAAGLDAGIVNPLSAELMNAYYAYNALQNLDPNCTAYIDYAGSRPDRETGPAAGGATIDLQTAIQKGLKEEAYTLTRAQLATREPLDIINGELMPALDIVGQGFEAGTLFLPQLLMSAEAAKMSFAVLREALTKSGAAPGVRPKVIVATVLGDVHDIGKNIVKVLLENYSFDVIDLGKDVPPETILQAALDGDVRLVGLSALMTTTVENMKATIELLREHKPDCRIMVGGAVLNQDYADMIGADFYGRDAMQSVNYAKSVLSE